MNLAFGTVFPETVMIDFCETDSFAGEEIATKIPTSTSTATAITDVRKEDMTVMTVRFFDSLI